MGRNFMGSKYDISRDTREIAALVRQEIKQGLKDGSLPKGLKTSVTMERFSGGSSCTITIKAIPFPLVADDYLAACVAGTQDSRFCRVERFSQKARDLRAQLEAMLKAYQRDDSDAMIDYFSVNFYAHCDFEYRIENREIAAAKEAAVLQKAS